MRRFSAVTAVLVADLDQPKPNARSQRLWLALVLLAVGIAGCTASPVNAPGTSGRTTVFFFAPEITAPAKYTADLHGPGTHGQDPTDFERMASLDVHRPSGTPAEYLAYGIQYHLLQAGGEYVIDFSSDNGDGIVMYLGTATFNGSDPLIIITE